MPSIFYPENFELGTVQVVCEVTENLNVNSFLLDKGDSFNAVNIVASESYSGSPVGHGTAWKNEIAVSKHLAMARLLEWDYNQSIEYDL